MEIGSIFNLFSEAVWSVVDGAFDRCKKHPVKFRLDLSPELRLGEKVLLTTWKL